MPSWLTPRMFLISSRLLIASSKKEIARGKKKHLLQGNRDKDDSRHLSKNNASKKTVERQTFKGPAKEKNGQLWILYLIKTSSRIEGDMKTFRQVQTCPWTWFPWQLITVVSPTFRLRATSHLLHPNSIFLCLSCLNISSSPPDSCLDQPLLNIPLQKLALTQFREDAKWIFITGRDQQATQCFLVACSVANVLLTGHWESSQTWAHSFSSVCWSCLPMIKCYCVFLTEHYFLFVCFYSAGP